ncbi:MAG TPA: Ig-like domain-containing protein, partial [Mycobacteriales bacterium]|nr:Ig-like domain-containing protein [Mycobacteriales bacterium]
AKTRSATFTIGNFQAPNTLVCTLTGPGGGQLPVNCGPVVTVDLTGQPDGSYVLQVGVRDPVGNVSTLVSATYVLDTTAPVAPTVTVAKTGNSRTPTLQVVTEPGATLTCTVQRFFVDVSTGPCPGGVVDLTGQADGDFEITVFATDVAGNTSPGTTVVYTLDTVAPAAPTLTAPASPSPLTNPVWRWTSEPGTVATCTLTRSDGAVVAGPVTCTGGSYSADLAAWGDDTYVFTVVLTDAAGNKSRVVNSSFVLDRTAPVPPTVVPPSSPNSSTSPRWTISAPGDASLTCTLFRGTTVVFGPAPCPSNGVFSLAGQPDGTYTLRVTATGANRLVSAAAVSSYVLDTQAPATPALTYDSGSSGSDRTPYWGFSLPSGTPGRCDLLHSGVVIASQSGCRGAVSFTIDGAPGTYTLRVVAIDSAGNASRALLVSYTLVGSGGTASAGSDGSGGVGSTSLKGTPPPTSSQVQQAVNEIVRAAAAAAGPLRRTSAVAAAALVPGLPLIHDQLTNDVSHAVQHVFNAVSKAGGGTGFPLLLLVIVGVFLLVQSRIDKRDPKLAFASVAADDNLQFRPPPSFGWGGAGGLNPGGAT